MGGVTKLSSPNLDEKCTREDFSPKAHRWGVSTIGIIFCEPLPLKRPLCCVEIHRQVSHVCNFIDTEQFFFLHLLRFIPFSSTGQIHDSFFTVKGCKMVICFFGPSSHSTREQICTQICLQSFDAARNCLQCCVNTPIGNNVFHFLLATFASTCASCVNGALANAPSDQSIQAVEKCFQTGPNSCSSVRLQAKLTSELTNSPTKALREDRFLFPGLSQHQTGNQQIRQ